MTQNQATETLKAQYQAEIELRTVCPQHKPFSDLFGAKLHYLIIILVGFLFCLTGIGMLLGVPIIFLTIAIMVTDFSTPYVVCPFCEKTNKVRPNTWLNKLCHGDTNICDQCGERLVIKKKG